MTSLLPGGSLGRYQVIEQIGRGGMATVFKALDPSLKRDVAVKVLPSYMTEDPSFVERFSQEAQAAAGLIHPNIIRVYDFGEDKGFTYIVMEYLPGGTLRDRLDEKMDLPEAIEFIRPLTDALDFAHGRGIIHRDIKLNNVLLDAGGKPILADFGLARMLEGSGYLTQGREVLGTADYMAPEQALGRPADQRSDLYSFGIMIYQMLLGQTPFHADTPPATLMAHVHQAVPLPTQVDPAIDARLQPVLLKALAKDPGDRYQTAKELKQALEETMESGAPSEVGDRAPAESPPASADPTVRHEIEGEEQAAADVTEPGRISLQQARLLAIQHCREHTEFYGRSYAESSLVWEVMSQEDVGDYYEIKLAYRPSGRFRGEPGVEQFTIGKTGTIELRQILDEPVENRPANVLLLVAVGIVIFAIVGAVWFGVVGTGGGAKDKAAAETEVAAGVGESPESPGTAPEAGPTAVLQAPAVAETAPTEPDTAATLAVVNAYFEAFNSGDIDKLTDMYTDNVVLTFDAIGGGVTTQTGKEAALRSDRQAAADKAQITFLTTSVEGNTVKGEFSFTEPSLAPAFTGTAEIIVEGGQIASFTTTYDEQTRQMISSFTQPAGADPSPTTHQSTPTVSPGQLADLSSKVRTIFQRVSEIRELDPRTEVVPKFAGREEIRRLVLKQSVRPEEEVAQREALLKALGMVPPDLDLYALSLGLLNEGFDQGQGDSAVYDLETNEFYVAEDLAELKPGDEFQIAAEYARALLYQHFDLDRLTEQSAPDSEATRALEILILADTAFAGQRYMAKHISPDRLIGLSSGPEQPVFDSAPRFVQREAFAAQAGINFISALSESGGTAAMGLVYANPPISTEQIYHPDKYLGGEAPVEVTLPDLPTALGPQWDEIFGGVMGESFLSPNPPKDVLGDSP